MKGFKKNLSWIFFGNILHAVFQYIINIICARSFGTNDYGLINYASSLIAFFVSIGTLGFNGIITKKFAEDEEKAGEYLGTAIFARILFSVVAIGLLQGIVFLSGDADPALNLIVFCQSLQILFGTFDLFVYWFRYKSEAKTVAIVRLAAFGISAVWRLVSIVVLRNIVLYVLGISLETAFFSAFLFWFFRKGYREKKLRWNGKSFVEMLRISYPFISSALLATIYGQTDKVMLKGLMDNTAVALYSVSQTLAGLVSIIPMALMEGFRPDIMTYKLSDEAKYRKRFQQLYGLVFWICIAYGLFVTVFAKYIILILYGAEYIGAVSSLSLIVWYTSFSYFGAINNIYMVAENKTVWVQITTLVGALVNIGLNFLMIPKWGIVGAAGASLITQIIANFVLLLVIKPLRGNFYLMVQGIAFRGFDKNTVKDLMGRLRRK